MTYAEAAARILGLRGGEHAGFRPGLERIETMLTALGNPEQRYRIAQVGGTNGKGSIAAMLAAICTAAGLKTGLYTSPHLCSFRERIRVDGRAIPRTDVVDGVEAIGTLVARLDASMFEASTALALDHFAREEVDIAVLEVGLGGRFDATTVGRPEVEVIGQIDLDHQAVLGSTLPEIAAEKAAIIRSGVALSAHQDPRPRPCWCGAPRTWTCRSSSRAGTSGPRRGASRCAARRSTSPGRAGGSASARCGLLGVYQPANAVLAAGAARFLGIEEGPIRLGLSEVRWPGRFQILQENPVIVLDGAHNPAGARALAASLSTYFADQPVTFVLGIFADKDAAGILDALLPVAARVIVTSARNPRALPAKDLLALVQPHARRLAYGAESASSIAAALALATEPALTPVICVAGSLYLIGEVLAHRGRAPLDILGSQTDGA